MKAGVRQRLTAAIRTLITTLKPTGIVPFKGIDGQVALGGLFSGALVLFAMLGLGLTTLDIVGPSAAAWNGWLVAGGVFAWLLMSWRLVKMDGRTWQVTLQATAALFTPLLILWPLQTRSFWVEDRDIRLFIISLAISLTVGLLAYRIWPGRLNQTDARWLWLVVAAAAAYMIVFGIKNVIMYASFRTGGSTPAPFDQALWNGAHWFGSGEPLRRFMSSSLCCNSILSDHAFLILLAFLPVYAVGLGSAQFLMITQSVAAALAAIALYLLGRKRLGPAPAALVGLAYLAFFVNQRTSAGDFRTDAFVAPLLLFAWYAFSCRRMGWYYGLVVLALACKEEVSFVVIALGIYLILFERAPRIGVTTALLAAVWFVMDAMVIMPYFGNTITRFYPYYRALGNTPAQIASAFVLHPGRLSAYLLDLARIKYLLFLFVPVGFAALLGAPALIVAAPRLALNLLSGSESHFSLIFWYEFNITPFLFVATIGGLERLGRWAGPRRATAMGAGAVYVLCGCLLSSQFWGPNPLREIAQLRITDHAQLAETVFDLIPPDASVSAQSNLVAHLAHRRSLFVLPDVNHADYILFDAFDPNRGPQPQALEDTLRSSLNDPNYGLVFSQDGYLLFRRGANSAQNATTLALVAAPQIQHPMRVALSGKIAFLGYNLSRQNATPGEPIYLTTYWQSQGPVSYPYLLITGYPGTWNFTDWVHGLYPVTRWRPGEIVKDEQMIVLPALPDGEDYEVALGLWYDQGPPRLSDPKQLLGNNVIRIIKITAKSGQYTLTPQ
jgi:uncharacterized membrane protein